jgi:hypothetical protein
VHELCTYLLSAGDADVTFASSKQKQLCEAKTPVVLDGIILSAGAAVSLAAVTFASG